MNKSEKIADILGSIYDRSKSDKQFFENAKYFKKKILFGHQDISGLSEYEFDRLAEETVREKKEIFMESILDPINKERCPDVFDRNDKMHEKVRKQILDLVEQYKQASGVDFAVEKIYMVGSLTSFNYSETSDVDIDLLVSMSKEDFKKTWPFIPKGVLLEGTNRPINFFVVLTDEDFEKAIKHAEAIYDVGKNDWVKKINKEDSIQIPYAHLSKVADFFALAFDATLGQYERDKEEYNRYSKLDPETQDISEKEKAEKMDEKLNDIRADYDKLVMGHHILFAFENEGYQDMPFRISIDFDLKGSTSARYSPNNIVYKILDSWGYLEKIDNAAKEAKDFIARAKKDI